MARRDWSAFSAQEKRDAILGYNAVHAGIGIGRGEKFRLRPVSHLDVRLGRPDRALIDRDRIYYLVMRVDPLRGSRPFAFATLDEILKDAEDPRPTPTTFRERVERDLVDPNGSRPNYRAIGTYVGRTIRGSRIPKDLSGEWTTPHGVKLVILPASGAYAKHRIFFRCSCGKVVPVGRLGQHFAGRKHP